MSCLSVVLRRGDTASDPSVHRFAQRPGARPCDALERPAGSLAMVGANRARSDPASSQRHLGQEVTGVSRSEVGR